MSLALGVIPARYAATRFPGKPLASLWGKPLVQHVWERARDIAGLDQLVIATDDERIERVARGFGAEVERTSHGCASGTDRVAEVARRRAGFQWIVNLQGDEPELDAGAVARLLAAMRADRTLRMGTLAHREVDPAALASEHVVKVVVDDAGFALYFTRRPPTAGERALRHIGVYAFTHDTLLAFASWPPTDDERRERLEQLRALAHGVRIRVVETAGAWTGVDTPEQLAALEARGPLGIRGA
ncbi:MAG TPA: 3-deoxy-manno-octulosonate cytidylyltransferase [Candidatus Eisenbacteria bacterium]|nr:3-deoxy-manno-octulosonate cytidylyltransferase [Candidatus Eisenbacteria bacterium]